MVGFVIKQGNFKIHISLLMILTLFFILGQFNLFISCYISIFLHEVVHILVAKYFRCPLDSFYLYGFGANAFIDLKNAKSIKVILFIYAAGPIFNGLFSMLLYLIYITNPSFVQVLFLSKINLVLMIFNILPIHPLDGGMLLFEILNYRFGMGNAIKVMSTISAIIKGVIALFCVVQVIMLKSIGVGLFGLVIVCSIRTERWNFVMTNIKNIDYRRAKLLKSGIYPGRELVVLKTKKVLEVLKCLDFDRIHLIYVLDEKMKMMKVFTEQEIMDELVNYDSEVTFEELLKES